MDEELRRSSRTNKGMHTGREASDVYYSPQPEEPPLKRAKIEQETPEPAAEPATENAQEIGELEGQVRCDGCGTTEENYDEETDDGGLMIECERCKTWQHAKCMGYRTQRSIPKLYLCNRCDEIVNKVNGKGSKDESFEKMGKVEPVNPSIVSQTPMVPVVPAEPAVSSVPSEPASVSAIESTSVVESAPAVKAAPKVEPSSEVEEALKVEAAPGYESAPAVKVVPEVEAASGHESPQAARPTIKAPSHSETENKLPVTAPSPSETETKSPITSPSPSETETKSQTVVLVPPSTEAKSPPAVPSAPATGTKMRSRPVPLNPKAAQTEKTRASVTSALVNVIVKAQKEECLDAEKWGMELENAVYSWAGSTDKRYIEKSRSVMALVKKPAVLARLISNDLTPTDFTLKSVEDIDPELKHYAEKVRQESIRRSVLTVNDVQSQRIRRTHKGEEIVITNSEENNEEDTSSLMARKVDHRKFHQEKSPSPTTKNGYISAPVPALYQLGDDDEEGYHNKDAENNDTMNEEANDSRDDVDDADDGNSDDELAYILKAKASKDTQVSPKKDNASSVPEPRPVAPKIPPTMPTNFWSGDIIFPDVATFGVSAEFVTCTGYEKPQDVTTASFHNRAVRVCKELLERKSYQIEGRLDRAKADPYLEQIVKSRDLFLVRLIKEHPGYTKVYEHLKSRAKVGVLSGRASMVKDAYLFALTSESPSYLKATPITEGLYALFSVKKDYIPVGKSLLKKIQPESQPPAIAVANLESILSKLEGDMPDTQNNSRNQTSVSGIPHLPQKPSNFPPAPIVGGHASNNNIHPERQVQTQNLTPQLSHAQMSYLSSVVQQNPHVQSDPQALLTLLQQMQT